MQAADGDSLWLLDAGVVAALGERVRALLATLFASRGTIQLTAGDEFGRSQRGNNNAYCQDNELSWLSWEWSEEERKLFDFTRRVLRSSSRTPSACSSFSMRRLKAG